MKDNGIVWYTANEVRMVDSLERKEHVMKVYAALKEKGYNPVSQIVGYILSDDPTYITNHNGARSLISHVEREDLLRDVLICYLNAD